MFFFDSRARVLKCGKWILTTIVFFALPLLMIALGLGRLCDGLEETAYEADEMFRRFEEFTKGTKPNDDVSIICLKRLS